MLTWIIILSNESHPVFAGLIWKASWLVLISGLQELENVIVSKIDLYLSQILLIYLSTWKGQNAFVRPELH